MAKDSDSADQGRRPWKFIGALGTALLVAMATAIGTGLGGKVLDLFDEEGNRPKPKPPVTYSAEERVFECGTALFVGGDRAASLASGEIEAPLDWHAFRRSNRAVVASPSVVEASIQGESSRTITLSRIEFSVERRPRPAGATFSNPCGDAISGRFVEADLDRNPVRVSGSSEDPEGIVGSVDPRSGRSPYEPIRFPWTVSVSDPLLLKVVARTKRCYCTWRARIPWRSGAKSGVIAIDNRGEGYEVAGGEGTKKFARRSSPSGWTRFD
jgi:hypothetical protein